MALKKRHQHTMQASTQDRSYGPSKGKVVMLSYLILCCLIRLGYSVIILCYVRLREVRLGLAHTMNWILVYNVALSTFENT